MVRTGINDLIRYLQNIKNVLLNCSERLSIHQLMKSQLLSFWCLMQNDGLAPPI